MNTASDTSSAYYRRLSQEFRHLSDTSQNMIEAFEGKGMGSIAGALMTTKLVYDRLSETFAKTATFAERMEGGRQPTQNEQPKPGSIEDLLRRLREL